MNELIEQLADQEHERWSSWMKYMFDNWVPENIERWKNQMATPYSQLPEHSKESDRKEARKTMKIVGPIVAQLETTNAELLEALKVAYDGLLLAEGICGIEAWRFVKSRQQAHQAICLAADQS